jgi:XTP/dITP diphosphohydrolase
MRQLVLATTNKGKIVEFERLLNQYAQAIKVLGLTDFPNMPQVEESGSTLAENAKLKAKSIAIFTKLPCLADDSGLFIDALAGEPGVYSARWAGYEGEDAQERDRMNIEKVLRQLKDVPVQKRSAQFKAVVAFYKPDANGLAIEKEELGVMSGEIVLAPLGHGGFGYDPIFKPTGFDQTLAQLPPEVKDAISHRGIALRAMTPFLLSNL